MNYYLFLAVLLAVATSCHRSAPELVDLGEVPAWQMLDQQGQTIGSATLKGRPWIANFLFTSCPTSCPPLARATHDLQEKLRPLLGDKGTPPLQIVSISVDPETDTPQRLTEFGKTYGADPRIWHLATAGDDYAAMEKLVTQGFMLPVLRNDRTADGHVPADKPTPLDTAHSLRFVLVDARGHIVGLFDKDEPSLAKLVQTATYLVQ